MTSRAALDALSRAADAAVGALSELGSADDWALSGLRPTQYRSDVVADEAIRGVLEAEGLTILSEEVPFDRGSSETVVVVDPLDGSTNASRSLPWFATSLCAVDHDGAVASVVHNLASGDRFDAERGGGARLNGEPIARPDRSVSLAEAIVAVNDVPPADPGWSQFRCYGASALDLCAVAEGRFDGYVDFAYEGHGVWDYCGAVLVCREVGIEVADAFGRELTVLDREARRTPIAASAALIEQLRELRLRGAPAP